MNTGFQLFPDRASTMAYRVDQLVMFQLIVSAFFALLILAAILYLAVKYHRPMADMNKLPNPKETPSSVAMELTWTFIPWLIVMVWFAWGAKLYVEEGLPPKDAIEIHVIAKQWMWKFQYPDGRREIDSLTVPLGKPVLLVMTSQDVVHSLGVPAFRTTQDVLPGRYSYEWFNANKPGDYRLYCREYCGTGHSRMVGFVHVMKPADYQRWLAEVPKGVDSPADAGRLLYEKTFRCWSCHGVQAPTLAGLYNSHVQVNLPDGREINLKADENYLRESILYPRAKIAKGFPADLMPSYQGQMSEEQLYDLIEFLKSKGVGSRPGVGGNQMDSGSRMQEQNPAPPQPSSPSSDSQSESNGN